MKAAFVHRTVTVSRRMESLSTWISGTGQMKRVLWMLNVANKVFASLIFFEKSLLAIIDKYGIPISQ